MTKKGENIYKRKDGRWEGRYIKKRDENRRIIYGYVYGKKYTEVKEKLLIIKAKVIIAPASVNTYYGTYGDWLSYWMDTYMRRSIKNTTFYNYYRLINKHIIPTMGAYRLHTITRLNIQHFIDYLVDKNLSSGTIRNIFNILKKSFREAVNQNFLEQNPCDNIILPKFKRSKVRALSTVQQQKLELRAFQSRECSPVIIALYTGMRIGEISGLKWSDIDFEMNQLSVKRTFYRVLDEENPNAKTKMISGTPKSPESERIIPIAENLKKYLLEKRFSSNSEYVISNRKGDAAEPRLINYRFKKLIKEAEIENVHFHILRHTFATRCLEKGIDIASLSRLLGHQSTKMTLDTYTDSMFEKRQEAMETIDKMLNYMG
ncbi:MULTISPECIES: tyrosine-type recombinase/integrase [unclassified Enterococcus]|uniref:tyrosine-type recombinase/integrase n=1 Tax=unclassified Enterococcus TaxID=2608891 RepID=UPI001CE047BA|nr:MULTISPECIES: site-specific integrase [unclassified Enterococcus]MCA5011425.1 site-specific integrase [Enterococcus sp. S23]MCA5015133.1 site-specific integrase [Enterococcus sp. S22(2020)]